MRKCPPGIICVENMTMLLILFIIIGIGFFMMKHTSQSTQVIVERNENNHSREIYPSIIARPNYGYNNLPEDVLMNPYVPPIRDERYLVSGPVLGPVQVPINISTNVGAVDTSYRQVGMLTPLHESNNDSKKNNILALMGRPLFVSRDKWQYYTMSDQKNSIKLPIIRNGKSGTSEYGIDRLFGGDHVFVEGYNQPFKVTIYDNNSIQYLPVM